jgi:tetratricopeptide (TPR) repeat protein
VSPPEFEAGIFVSEGQYTSIKGFWVIENHVYGRAVQLKTQVRRYIKKTEENGQVILLCVALVSLLSCVSCRKSEVDNMAADSADPKAAAERVSEADQLYRGREDLAKVRQAVNLMRQARMLDSSSFDAAWKLAQVNYYLGDHTTDDRERDTAFEEGMKAGKAAVNLQPNKPEGHFWLGANYGGSAEHSTIPSLTSVEDIQREMGAVLKIEEGFQSGSAYLVLGQLYLKAPRIVGGNYQKAVENLEKGLKFGATNGLLRLRLAEAYHAVSRDADARKQVDELLASTPDPNYLPEQKEAVEEAKRLLAKLGS